MTAAAWVGWGGEPEHPAAQLERLPVVDWPGPPQLQHVRFSSCCAWCSDDLSASARCTPSIEAVWAASDDELRYGGVAGCVLDREDELVKRAKRRRYQAFPEQLRRGLRERLGLMKRTREPHDDD